MIKPAYLKQGDRVGMVSPAGKITSAEVKASVKVLQRWGLEPVFGRHIFSSDNQFAGKDEERAADIQEFLDDINVKAIISTRGGYGSARIIDMLDFSKFKIHPKWFVGYSDVTVFHNHIHTHLQTETLHATMPINFPEDFSESPSVRSLKRALFGELDEYALSDCKLAREGFAQAPLVGGNLSILYSLAGTASDISTKGKILFIEDLAEYLYHIDRMMISLKRGGKLAGLKGLIVGGLTEMNDNKTPYGKTAEEIIWDAVKEYDFPVVMNFPAGHQKPNQALYLGREIQLNAISTNFFMRFL